MTHDSEATSVAKGHSPEEVAALFDVAGTELKAMRRLTGCVADLQEVQDAKHALAALSADEVRAALLYRRNVRETG